MIWLQDPPWIRWSLAILIAIGAVWVEFREPAHVDHPFAVVDISPGDEIDGSNTEVRPAHVGLFDPVEPSGFASHQYLSGDPITAGGIDQAAPGLESGWWTVEVELPSGALVGTPARLVLVDSGVIVEGIVAATPDDDPLGTSTGSIALTPEDATLVAPAIPDGRFVILLATR